MQDLFILQTIMDFALPGSLMTFLKIWHWNNSKKAACLTDIIKHQEKTSDKKQNLNWDLKNGQEWNNLCMIRMGILGKNALITTNYYDLSIEY